MYIQMSILVITTWTVPKLHFVQYSVYRRKNFIPSQNPGEYLEGATRWSGDKIPERIEVVFLQQSRSQLGNLSSTILPRVCFLETCRISSKWFRICQVRLGETVLLGDYNLHFICSCLLSGFDAVMKLKIRHWVQNILLERITFIMLHILPKGS
jgi:hypothetical protein